MINTILTITILIGAMIGFALFAVWRQRKEAFESDDVGELNREPSTPSVVTRTFGREYTITGVDALSTDIEEDRDNWDPFTALSVIQAFDQDYAVIWSTQISALHLVDNAGTKGLPVKQLYPFYARGVRRYPELYDGSSFGSWLEFLEREQLITRTDLQVRITTDGHKFLEYRPAPESTRTA